MTAPSACPYLPDRLERKIFTHLPLSDGAEVNDVLTQHGFRRSQNIAYRPACDRCQACTSVRILAENRPYSRSEKRILKQNQHLSRALVEAEATLEQFELLKLYLSRRHPDGGMSDMNFADYVAMIEDTTVRSHLIEYRTPSQDGAPGDLVACILVDVLNDGLSLVYSFYDPRQKDSSLGSFMILDHIHQAMAIKLPYVYLGYWVKGSPKMDYKIKFHPLELLTLKGWTPFQEVKDEDFGNLSSDLSRLDPETLFLNPLGFYR